jgi:hypothetical protein
MRLADAPARRPARRLAYYRTRLDRERDAATDADLELAGYRLVRLNWTDVTTHSASTTRRLRSLLSDT